VKIKLAYGKTGLKINLPDDANVTVVEPKYVDGLPDQASALREALRQPIGSPPLQALVKPSDKVGIVFSDITRPTPNALMLSVLLDEINHVPDERIALFNSTGTHRPNTDAELRGMLGDEIADRFRIVQNDANDRDSHVRAGRTSSGNEVWIHREFVECDVRIPTGFIEPHFFAGFSGGGKAIMPGLALLDTVMHNHSAANMDSPLARWGITHGNERKSHGPGASVLRHRDHQQFRIPAGLEPVPVGQGNERGCAGGQGGRQHCHRRRLLGWHPRPRGIRPTAA
jgi:nickel-dependent lactate racemase